MLADGCRIHAFQKRQKFRGAPKTVERLRKSSISANLAAAGGGSWRVLAQH
jgi:hypothetical protein